MGKQSFVFYEDWVRSLSILPPEIRLLMLDSIMEYFITGIRPTFNDPRDNALFHVFAERMDRDAEAYETKCKKLRANASKSKQMLPNASKSKQIWGDNVNDNDNDNDNVNDNVNANEDDVNVILASSPITKEDLLRKYRITEEQLRHYGELFNEENKGKKYNANDSPMKHFINWLAKRVKKDKEDYGNNRPSYEQRAEGAAQLVAKFLAEGDEVRNEGAIPIDF